MRTPFLQSSLCGLLPLTAGIGVWAWWRVAHIDALLLAGMVVIAVGCAMTLIGAGLWFRDLGAARRHPLRATVAALLLLGCYPAAAAVTLDAVRVSTEYVVVVNNDSGAEVTSCRVFGGGLDSELGPIPAGGSAEVVFLVAHDDTLLCELDVAGSDQEVVLDGYVTNSLGGRAALTIDDDGVPTVRHSRR